jgi:quercetin dioxygenase-like cupin family protein
MPFIQLTELKEHEIIPGYRAVFIHTDQMTLAYWDVAPDAEMPVHSHPHEQVANVLEGEFELELDGDRRVLRPGSAARIPPNAPHGGRARTACRLLDVFYPVREDYQFE